MNLYGIAVSEFQVHPKGITCFRILEPSRIFIIVWDLKTIIIYGFIDQNSNLSFSDKENIKKEELNFKDTIVNVFVASEHLYAADISGVIFELSFKVFQVGEDDKLSNDLDMFEISPEPQQGWTKTKVGIIDECDKLLAISALNNKIVTIAVFSDKLRGHVYRVTSFHKIFVLTLIDSTIDKVVMCNIDLPLSNELREQYFPCLDPNDSEISLIGLNIGQILSFSLSKNVGKYIMCFSSVQPVVNIEYLSDDHKQRCIAILVLFSPGSLLMLKGKSCKVFYIANNIHYSLFNYDQSILLTSDGINTHLTKVLFDNAPQKISLKCSIKGLRAACGIPKIPNLILVVTQHCCIYWLDLSAIKTDYSSKFIMPKDKVLKELLITGKCLNEAHFKMKKEDSLMRAISLATRAKFLSSYFTILVKFFSGKNYMDDKLKLRIENNCDFTKFTEDLWSLSVTVSYGNSSSLSFVHKLEKPFSKDWPLIVEFKCSPIVESELSCKMIARLDDNQPLLIIPLGKVVLDAGYFLSIVKDKSKLLTEPSLKLESPEIIEYNSSDVSKCVKTMSNNNGCRSDKKIFAYSIKLESPESVNNCFQILFCNSLHRMSKNQWQEICDPNLLEVNVLIGQKYWIELKLDKEMLILHIKSNDIYACYLVNRAVSTRLGCHNPVQLDSDIFVETEGIKYRYELARLKTDWNLNEFQDIKNEFRSHIVKRFSMQKK